MFCRVRISYQLNATTDEPIVFEPVTPSDEEQENSSNEESGNASNEGPVNAGINKNSGPSKWGGPTIQFLTPECFESGGLFYDGDNKKLFYTDRYESIINIFNYANGEMINFHNDDNEGEQLAFLFPQKGYDKTKLTVLGAGRYVQQFVNNQENGTTGHSSPIAITEDKAYVICDAHTDANGVLFLSLNSKADKTHKGGKLYKFEKNLPVLIKEYKKDISGIAFSQDSKKMFLIAEDNRVIYQYKYDPKVANINSEEKIFELPKDFPDDCCMTGVETDEHDCLWITVDSCGVVLEFDTKSRTIWQIIQMPITTLTGITFGGNDFNGLFISTSKKCKKPEIGTGSVLYLSGINGTGVSDVPVKW